MVHDLKCWTSVFKDVVAEKKTYEFRKNDRGFKVGDTLLLKEWNPGIQAYTGDADEVEVGYVTEGGQFGIPDGYCIMGIYHEEGEPLLSNKRKNPYIPPVTCVRCGKVLKPMDPKNGHDYGMVHGGVVGKLYAPYGSENDGTIFQIGICDDCIKSSKAVGADGKLEPSVKAIGDYMDSDMDTEIKHKARMGKFKETGTYTVGGEDNAASNVLNDLEPGISALCQYREYVKTHPSEQQVHSSEQ